jgi:hypothetical protein
VHLLVDSTGLRLCGSGEWLIEKHGTRRRRSWRKLHIGVDADVIVPPRSTAVLNDMAEGTPSQRDRHLQSIAEHGRIGWQKKSGYTRRALVETSISRFKRVIGDALRSQTDRRRATEVAIAVHALNRMLELGRPKSVRIA